VRLSTRCALVVPAALILSALAAAPASAAVTVARADLSGSNLRIEGTATANRDITVDGAVLGRSDSGGKFRIAASGYTAPPDCTVDVNDATGPRNVRLTGCTVTAPPPPSPTAPTTPAPVAPAAGAGVTSPLTLSWTQVLQPSSLNGGYNWQISTSATMSPLVTRDSTNPATTSAVVGSLVPGTYFWQVQAVTAALDISPWSPARSFVVTGAGAGALGAPVLAPLPFGTAYHPFESFPFSWSAVPGAASYTMEASRDAGFTAPVDLSINNIPVPNYGLTMHDTLIGTWFLRIRAVDASFVPGPASNVRTFTISYNAPVGPPPLLLSPADGAVVQLPFVIDWSDVPNPQDLGYELQVSSSSTFGTLEIQGPTSTSQYSILGLSAGQHFWRIRASQGNASLTTSAMTAWSQVRSFTVSAAAAKIATVTILQPSAFSGEFVTGELQLTGPAPAGGATITLTSSAPGATPLPATIKIDAGFAYTQFSLTLGHVTTPTTATITAAYGGASATTTLDVKPTSLKGITPSPLSITGGAVAGAMIAFNGSVPPAGAAVSVSSSSLLAVPPAVVNAPGGTFFQPFTIQTSQVSVATPVTLTFTYNGGSITHTLTLLPAVPPSEWTVDLAQTTGSQGAFARVAIAELQTTDQTFTLTSSNPAVASMNTAVTISAGSPHAGVIVTTYAPTVPTTVTLTVSGAGVSKSVTLVVNPYPTSPLAAPSLVAPAASARFAPNAAIPFDWADVAGAASYTLQVGTSSAFTSTLVNQTVTLSRLTTSLAATGDRFWRVRANRADGSAGAWSAARSVRIK
jgi:predicted secreted protein